MKNGSIVKFGAVLLFVFIYGCAGNPVEQPFPEPRPLGNKLASFRAPSYADGGGGQKTDFEEPEHTLTLRDTQATPFAEPADTLSLRDALSIALMRNPELASISWERRAEEAVAIQQGLFPNPELGVEVENVDGKGPGGAFDVTETTLSLSQLLEIGGKRSKRSRVAGLRAELAGWDYESKRLDVLSGTKTAFFEVLAAQERIELSVETFRLSDRVYDVVAERVRAGKVSPLEKSKASVSRSLSEIQMEKEKRGLSAAIKRLASYWGSSSPRFTAVAGELDIPESIPIADADDSLAEQNPELARWTTQIERHRMALALAKTERIPDLTLSGGVKLFEETDETMFVFGLSVPIPLFDRNQGGVREAEYLLARAGEQQKAAGVHVRTVLSEALGALSSSHAEALVLKNVVLPAAEQAFVSAGEGYRHGKFEFLEVLDAQKTFAEVRYQYIDALIEYHRSIAAVERLIGRGLDTIPGHEHTR